VTIRDFIASPLALDVAVLGVVLVLVSLGYLVARR